MRNKRSKIWKGKIRNRLLIIYVILICEGSYINEEIQLR